MSETTQSCNVELLAFDVLSLFLSPAMHRNCRRRETSVGRLSGGAVVWVARHGCRASAAGPGMALRRVPAPRCRSEGTPGNQGPYVSENGFPPLPKQRGSTARAKPDISSADNLADATRLPNPNPRQQKGAPELPSKLLHALFYYWATYCCFWWPYPCRCFRAIPIRDQEQTYFFER